MATHVSILAWRMAISLLLHRQLFFNFRSSYLFYAYKTAILQKIKKKKITNKEIKGEYKRAKWEDPVLHGYRKITTTYRETISETNLKPNRKTFTTKEKKPH